MLISAVITSINHVLCHERWACKRLQSYTDMTVCIQIPPIINFKILIDAKGEVKQANDDICVDTTVTLSPLILSRLLTQDRTAFKLIKTTGNQSFADDLIDISKHINFGLIIEHNLSKTIGDIPAHRITKAGEHMMHWQIENFNRMSQALVEYWTEEDICLTKSVSINKFIHEVKDLQLNTEQLEQRLNRLIRQGALTNE